MVALGNATSLLAFRLIEKMKHECEHEGCQELIPFADLKKHQLVCLFRKVLCPGSRGCNIEITFNKVEEHIKVCPHIEKEISNCEKSSGLLIEKNETERGLNKQYWNTLALKSDGKYFFARSKRENNSHCFEVVMLGSQAMCKYFLAKIAIFDEEGKVFTRKDFRPRPISLEDWGRMGLVVPEEELSSIWRADPDEIEKYFCYDIKISVKNCRNTLILCR